jgi:hypothetical protein
MSDFSSVPIRAITTRHSLSPTSHTRASNSVPCGSPAQRGQRYGLIVFCISDDGRLGAGFSPVSPKSSLREWQARRLTHTPFWFVPDSIFGTSQLTGFNADSHMFTLLPSLAPCRIMLAASHLPRGIRFTLAGSGYIVRMASDIAVTHHACIPRLLPEERQVLSSDHKIASRTITHATSRRTAMSCSRVMPSSA